MVQNAKRKDVSYSKRLLFNNQAFKISIQQKNDSINRSYLLQIAKNYYHLNNWQQLKKTTKILYRRSNSKNDLYNRGESSRWLGVYYEGINVYDSAFYYYLKAQKDFRCLKNQTALCLIYQDIAQVQYYINDYLSYEQSLINALRIAKKNSLNHEQYRIYVNLGISCEEQHNYTEAFEYFNKALHIVQKIDFHNHEIAFCLNNIGTCWYEIGKPNKAILLYKEALKDLALSREAPLIYCRLIDNLSNSNLQLKRLSGIEAQLMSTSLIRDSLKIDEGKVDNCLFLSNYFELINQNPKSIQYALQSLNLSKKFHSPAGMLFSLKQLAKVEPKNALKYSTEYIKISDSMQQLERETRNKFAKIAYETEEITSEKEAAIHQKYIFLGLAILVFLIGVLLFIVIRQRIKQNKMVFMQEQQKNNEEIYQLIQSQQTKINEGRQIEKKRIAQDLHDGIMNKLAATRLNLNVLKEKNDRETIERCLFFVNDIQNIEKEIRNIAHDLNKEAFSNNDSFITILESLFEKQKNLTKTKCHYEIDSNIEWDLIESTKRIHIYRILQEALSNINKHAKAQNIVISMIKVEEEIFLEIFDDGIGFSLKGKKKGIGLQNIYSRTNAFKGSIAINSEKGIGTTLMIIIPQQ